MFTGALSMHKKNRAFFFGALMAMVCALAQNVAAAPTACDTGASDSCYFSFKPAGQSGLMHYYASVDPASKESAASMTSVLVAMHGHPRDANKTFNAALLAVKSAGDMNRTLVIAPVYQVANTDAKKCSTKGVPTAAAGDLLWTCESWLAGGASTGSNKLSSFTAMDALIVQLRKDFPNLRTMTVAGFSAGAQMVQHYIGFAADLAEPGVKLRYVVSDPGAWLYFDQQRAQAYRGGIKVSWAQCFGGAQGLGDCELKLEVPPVGCASMNAWKYGLEQLPKDLPRDGAQARAHYAAADISYLEGQLDSSQAKGTYYGILDKSCAANAQGPYRMQRGVIYAFYDRTLLAPDKQRKVTIVPNCAHDVACVFPGEQARAVLLGR
jgi:hypothetical protein